MRERDRDRESITTFKKKGGGDSGILQCEELRAYILDLHMGTPQEEDCGLYNRASPKLPLTEVILFLGHHWERP